MMAGRKPFKWTEKDKQWLKNNYNNLAITKQAMTTYIGCTYEVLEAQRKKLGLPDRQGRGGTLFRETKRGTAYMPNTAVGKR